MGGKPVVVDDLLVVGADSCSDKCFDDDDFGVDEVVIVCGCCCCCSLSSIGKNAAFNLSIEIFVRLPLTSTSNHFSLR